MRGIWAGIAVAAMVGLAGQARAQEPAPAPAYVGSAQCADCHTDAAAAWAGSHHALAWTAPDGPVLGDFDDATFTHKGVTTRFWREDGRPMIASDGPDGAITTYPVQGVAGIAPLQQYLLETEPGRLQSFDVVWDAEQNRWYHLYPDLDLPAGDGLHWTGPYKTWNARCAECHATGYEKAYDPATRSYASTQAEIGVGCEACHGPGAAHVAWAETGQPAPHAGLTDTGLTMDFAGGGTAAYIEQCATCHARREAFLDGNPLPGTPFDDAYRLATLRPGLYHADGQILDEVYVYGSFLQSKMYARGVGCGDCHDPHTAERLAEGNALCAQCHNPDGNPRFPTLRGAAYDTPAHHFHAEGSAGAQCSACHMIERVYMGIDGRRDHSFRIPRPDLAGRTGGPDACTDCHTDQTPDWAAQVIEGWFPDSPRRGPHYGTVLAAGRADRAGQAQALADLAEAADMPAIVRASALEILQDVADPALAARLAPLLADSAPRVRALATAVQRGAAPADRVARLVPLLGDDMRSVRIAAARALLDTPASAVPPDAMGPLQGAMGDWRSSLRNKADFPETQLIVGGVALTMRDMRNALAAFGEATRQDPQRTDAWAMQVRIRDALGDRPGARRTLTRALSINPDDPSLQALDRALP